MFGHCEEYRKMRKDEAILWSVDLGSWALDPPKRSLMHMRTSLLRLRTSTAHSIKAELARTLDALVHK